MGAVDGIGGDMWFYKKGMDIIFSIEELTKNLHKGYPDIHKLTMTIDKDTYAKLCDDLGYELPSVICWMKHEVKIFIRPDK